MLTETLAILRSIIETSPLPVQIQSNVRSACARLQAIVPSGHVVSNACQRVLSVLAEEVHSSAPAPVAVDLRRSQSISFLAQLANPLSVARSPSGSLRPCSLRQPMLEAVDELLDEVATLASDISKRAAKFIHDGDLLLTIGDSSSVFEFFATAARLRRFAVIILENAPACDGAAMGARLRSIGVEFAVIADAAVFAVMPRVTTVFASARAVFADGTLIGPSFTQATFMAARHSHLLQIPFHLHNRLHQNLHAGLLLNGLCHGYDHDTYINNKLQNMQIKNFRACNIYFHPQKTRYHYSLFIYFYTIISTLNEVLIVLYRISKCLRIT
jgi:translation initiation factor 2B subunit (eIF-2B alpha/beta/delta family)